MQYDIEVARSILGGAPSHDASELHELIGLLATPRMSGTEGAEEVEASLREAFAELGYETRELPFSFSTWPGRFGVSVSGLLFAATGVGATAFLYNGQPVAALAVLVGGLLLTLLPLLFLGPAIRGLPLGRVDTSNLLFTRPERRPTWIVMAHRDSKSQLVPTLVRTAAIATGGAGWVVLMALAGLWYAGDLFRLPSTTLIVGAVMALAGLLLAASWASNRSPGALDNASGLAALLAVAGEGPGGDVGFLITDGEEMGLAGARAVVDRIPAVQGVINVEGLDDRGVVYVAEGHGWRRRGSAPQLVAALLTAGRALDIETRRRRLPRSILVDHLPIAAAGIPAVTMLRGRWRSLLRVHRPADSADRLDGRGAAEAATLLAAAVRLLRESEGSHLAAERSSAS